MPTAPSADASLGFIQPHTGTLRQRLFTPLNIAAYVTWCAVSVVALNMAQLRAGEPAQWAGVACLLAFLALFVATAVPEYRAPDRRIVAGVLLQGLAVAAAEACLKAGQTAVLLIIVAAQAATVMPVRSAIGFIALLDAGLAGLWYARTHQPSMVALSLVPVAGFQAFAALTGHYAASRERAREHLAQVNAELMATRLLLEESARAGERLKLSRELHDVAGHSLTALKLNLARLARDPALADREEVRVSTALADDLLAQIRQVVGALRAHDGVDLRAAFEALARPMPGVRIGIDIEDGLRVDDIDRAETLLRCAQEAITNALRHGRAGRIDLRLHRVTDGLQLVVENDGLAPGDIRPGNGLTGMRERVEALGGTLTFAPTPPRGLRLAVTLPEHAS